MKLFHGTTIENMKQILKEGFNNNDRVWNCSEDKTYFFTEEYFREYEDADDDNIIEIALNTAMDQSRIGLSLQNPKDYRGAVLVFETEFMNNKSEIEEDHSCPNMSDMAVCIENPDMNGLIAVYIMENDESCTRLFVLNQVKDMNYFEMPNLTLLEQAMLKSMSPDNDIVLNEHNNFIVYNFVEEIEIEENLEKAAA